MKRIVQKFLNYTQVFHEDITSLQAIYFSSWKAFFLTTALVLGTILEAYLMVVVRQYFGLSLDAFIKSPSVFYGILLTSTGWALLKSGASAVLHDVVRTLMINEFEYSLKEKAIGSISEARTLYDINTRKTTDSNIPKPDHIINTHIAGFTSKSIILQQQFFRYLVQAIGAVYTLHQIGGILTIAGLQIPFYMIIGASLYGVAINWITGFFTPTYKEHQKNQHKAKEELEKQVSESNENAVAIAIQKMSESQGEELRIANKRLKDTKAAGVWSETIISFLKGSIDLGGYNFAFFLTYAGGVASSYFLSVRDAMNRIIDFISFRTTAVAEIHDLQISTEIILSLLHFRPTQGKNINIGFNTNLPVKVEVRDLKIDGINLQNESFEFLSGITLVVGPSGAGKSSLLQRIYGFGSAKGNVNYSGCKQENRAYCVASPFIPQWATLCRALSLLKEYEVPNKLVSSLETIKSPNIKKLITPLFPVVSKSRPKTSNSINVSRQVLAQIEANISEYKCKEGEEAELRAVKEMIAQIYFGEAKYKKLMSWFDRLPNGDQLKEKMFTFACCSNLSTGQKQVIALFRALLNLTENYDTPINILILDEALGNIDKDTRKEVLKIIQEEVIRDVLVKRPGQSPQESKRKGRRKKAPVKVEPIYDKQQSGIIIIVDHSFDQAIIDGAVRELNIFQRGRVVDSVESIPEVVINPLSETPPETPTTAKAFGFTATLSESRTNTSVQVAV